MDIKKAVRTALLEGKHKNKSHKNKYGCVMVYLKVNKKDWVGLLDQIEDEDLYQPKDDPSYGKEHEPHVTILFGLHDDVPDADVEEEIDKIKTPELSFKGISAFSNAKFDVLKFDVESKDMHALNKKFKEFPYTSDFPDYHPHATICYLKPKTADKYIKKLKDTIDMEIVVEKVVYSKADGSKKSYKLKDSE